MNIAWFVVLIASVLAGSENDRILRPPPEASGLDAGLVIIPGAFLEYHQYTALALRIQSLSRLRLWVYLADGLLLQDNQETTIIGQGQTALIESGMPSEAPMIASGHSFGGVIAEGEVLGNPGLAEALIFFGARIFFPLENLKVPAISISGDIDGSFRVTSLLNGFNNLQAVYEGGDEEAIYRFPIALIQGMNHGQYCTGDLPPNVVDIDIPGEIDDDEARTQVAQAVNTFLEHWLLGETTQEGQVKDDFERWYAEAEEFFEPLQWAFGEEEKDGQSRWVIRTQHLLADLDQQDQHLLNVESRLLSKDDLITSRAQLSWNEDSNQVDVMTKTTVTYEEAMFTPVSALMLEAKMISSEGISDTLANHTRRHISAPSCRHANELAWSMAEDSLTPLSSARWRATNINVVFEDDILEWWGPGWTGAELKLEFADNTLTIQSSALLTSAEDFIPYAHYCKLLSPARAVEYMMIDGLKDASDSIN